MTLEEGPRIAALIRGVDAGEPQSVTTGMDLVLDLDEPGVLSFRPV